MELKDNAVLKQYKEQEPQAYDAVKRVQEHAAAFATRLASYLHCCKTRDMVRRFVLGREEKDRQRRERERRVDCCGC